MYTAISPGPVVTAGATIVQRVQFGLCAIESGVRVVDVWGADGPVTDAGFRYLTLAGHPECGVETFRVQLDAEAASIVLSVEAWSRPGHTLTWLGVPVARLIQISLTHAALRQFSG